MTERQADEVMARIAAEVSAAGHSFTQGWSLRKRELWGSGQWAVQAKFDHLLVALTDPDEWNDMRREWAGLPLKAKA